jgi:hypothetical protein
MTILPDHYNFRDYTDEQLEEFLNKLPFHMAHGAAESEHERRQKLTDRQLARDRHSQSTKLSEKTLFWAKVGGITASIGTVVLLVSDIGISKFLPSTSSRASPTSSPQTIPTVAPLISPSAKKPLSRTPRALPTSSPTSTPAS